MVRVSAEIVCILHNPTQCVGLRMQRRKGDHFCVQETKWEGHKAIGHGAEFKLYYGVGMILREEYAKNVVKGKRVSDNSMTEKLEIKGMMMNVVRC